MQTQTLKDFSQQVAASPELQTRIRAMSSVGEFMALSKELGFQFTGEDLQHLAQEAFQRWLADLQPHCRPFFEQLHADESMNMRHQACKSPEDVIAIATDYGFKLTVTDLQQAAQVAAAQEGFSFEKLWFQSLGMI